MLQVKDKFITEDMIVILQELQRQVENNGKNYFKEFIVTPDNIQFCCPVHNDGQEKKPSCGIKITGDNIGIVHCFSCGYVATLPEMINYCFDYEEDSNFGDRWLIKNFVSADIEKRKEIELDLNRTEKKENIKYITNEELEKYSYFHDYMYKRKLTDDIIIKFDVGYDKDTNCLTFPIQDEKGNVLFIARRSVNTKYFNYPNGVLKPLYGLYQYLKYCSNKKEIIICESILDALTCYVYGFPALALNGTGTKYQYEQIRKLENYGIRKIIAGFDGDVAGRLATQKLKKNVKNIIISDLKMFNDKDLNDLTRDDFYYLLDNQEI